MDRRLALIIGAAAALIVAAVVAVGLSGGFGGLLSGGTAQPAASVSDEAMDDEHMDDEMSDEEMSDEEMSDDESASSSGRDGVYADYSPDALAQAEGRILLFFHASWCPQCRSIESDIVAQGVPDGVTILKVDYDSNQPLRQEYGVTLQTSFVEVDTAGAALQPVYVAYEDPHLGPTLAALL